MNKMLMVVAALVVLMGCSSTPPPDFNNIVVTVAEGRSLKDAVVYAATCRHWIVNVVSDDTIRCTILQRSNKVEIDVVIHDRSSYSIKCVFSNISTNKYLQWVNNLQREIAKAAWSR